MLAGILSSHQIGTRLCRVALPVFLIASLTDLLWHAYWIAAADFLGALGCGLSLFLSHLFGKNRAFVWWPSIFTLWINSLTVINLTGGINSPCTAEYLAILLLVGAIIQPHVKIRSVILFTFLYFSFWVFMGIFMPARLEVVWPLNFICQKTAFFLFGVWICTHSLLKVHESLIHQTGLQNQKLIETRSQLIHTQKIAEVGNLVASTAHELAQPAQVISITSGLLDTLVKKDPRHEAIYGKLTNNLLEASARISSLLMQLKIFSKKEKFELRPLDLSECLQSVYHLVYSDMKSKGVKFEVKSASRPFFIRGDRSRLQQVFLNLISNARDATCSTSKPQVTIQQEEYKNSVRVFVTNYGPQIPLEFQAKIFQPYFSTKKADQGTGLGLVISDELIQQHHGRILFSSDQTETTFLVEFPMLPPELS